MVTSLILIILLLLIIEQLSTRHSNRLSFYLGVIELLLWLVATFKLGKLQGLL